MGPCANFGAGAGATVIHNTTQGPVGPFIPPRIDACTGEIVFLSGDLTSVQHTLLNPQGGSLTTLIIRWHSLTGTGSLGTEYTVNGGVTLVIQDLAPGQTVTTNAVERLITRDGGGNTLVLLVSQLTMNANGIITVAITDFSTECVADND